MTQSFIKSGAALCACAAALAAGSLLAGLGSARAQNQKPNIILILSDDFGYAGN